MFILRWWSQLHFLRLCDVDQSLPHALLQLRDFVDLQFEDFVVVGGEEAVHVLFECDPLGNHQDFILLCTESN
jgi:hypothetical protein